MHDAAQACATSFPQAINMASTFNRTAMRAMGFVIAKEMRALTNHRGGDGAGGVGLASWAPTINIIR